MESLSTLTMRSLLDYRLKAIGEDYQNIKSYQVFAQRFLKEFFPFNLHSASFDRILAEYKKQTQNENFPIVEDDFYYYICKEYLEIESLPRDKLVDLYISATEDLKLIDEELQYLENKKNTLSRKKIENKYLKGDDRNYLKLIEHYEQKNIAARNEIVDFITKDINHKSLRLSARLRLANSLSWLFPSSSPYSYADKDILGHKRFNFKIDNVSDIANKFLYLPLSKYKDLENAYKNDKAKFAQITEEYIDENKIVESIQELVQASHFISERSEVFDILLKSYKKGDFVIFNNIVPLQIEGLFGDYCLGIGVSESLLEPASLSIKLKHINDKIPFFYLYEYYAFRFPIIRNDVAHGKAIDGSSKHLAQMLLLDLYPVCQMLVSDELPIMKSLSLVKNIEVATNDSVFTSLIEWLDFLETDIPAFYNATELIAKAKLRYEDEEFWKWIKQEFSSSRNDESIYIIKFVEKLKTKKIAVEQCKLFFSYSSSLKKSISLPKISQA